ncbi:MAG: GNAT family N-acetyltransferase [Culicoidibacterales bacterium]
MIHIENWDRNKADRRRLRELYHQSFPFEERVPFWLLSSKTKRDENNWQLLYDDEEFIGLVYTACYEDIVFIWYFALLPDKQGSGYGSAILQMLYQKYEGKRLILNIEIDDPKSANNDERKRRKRFYLRNGYEECGFYTKEAGVEFEMLSCGGKIEYKEYQTLLDKYFGKILCRLFLRSVD